MHSPHNPDNDFKQEWCRRLKQKDISAQQQLPRGCSEENFRGGRRRLPSAGNPLLSILKCCPAGWFKRCRL